METSAALEKRISNLEEINNNVLEKLDVITEKLCNKVDKGSKNEMFNVVHYLLYHLENTFTSNQFIKIKLLQLKTSIAKVLYRKCSQSPSS